MSQIWALFMSTALMVNHCHFQKSFLVVSHGFDLKPGDIKVGPVLPLGF